MIASSFPTASTRVAARRCGVLFGAALLALSVLAPVHEAFAQAYPNRPIKLVVPYPPGGIADGSSRIFAKRLSEELKTPVVVENRAGAGGSLALQIVSKAPADGYTLVQSNPGPSAIAQAMNPQIGYTEKDFVAVTTLITSEMFMVVPAQSPLKSASDVIAVGRSGRSTPLVYGSSGIGAPSHLAGEMFNAVGQTKFTHVPYRGAAPLGLAVLQGEIDWAFMPSPDAIPQIRAGKMRALAVAAMKRSALAPEVPTMAEIGVTGVDLGLWYGLLAPAGTPPEAVQTLYRAIAKIAEEPETRAQLTQLNVVPLTLSPDEFSRLIAAEVVKYGEAVRRAGVAGK
jgi:tripartite-type tricarboxylate transporter receptor subunit TctC